MRKPLDLHLLTTAAWVLSFTPVLLNTSVGLSHVFSSLDRLPNLRKMIVACRLSLMVLLGIREPFLRLSENFDYSF